MRAAGLTLLLTLAACSLEVDHRGTAYRCPGGVCPEGFVCRDQVCRSEDAAVTPPDAARADAPPDVCALAAAAPDDDDCGHAIDLTAAALEPAGATAYGDTTGYADEMHPGVSVCTGGNFQSGPDAIYRLDVQASDAVSASLVPEGWDAGLYLIDACSTSASCLAGSDTLGAGSTESFDHVAAAAGALYLVVDSGPQHGQGCFTLHATIAR